MNKTNKKAPHIAIEKECYVSHNELMETVKKHIKYHEKNLDIQYKYCKEVHKDVKYIIDITNTIYEQLKGELYLLWTSNCINETKYQWWINYLNRNILDRYDETLVEMGL